MKIYILNKKGHETVTLEREELQSKIKELAKDKRYLVDKDGRRYMKAEDIPDTVEELFAGEELEYRGIHGYW